MSSVRVSFLAVLLVAIAVAWQDPVSTEASTVASISAGDGHTCTITAGRDAKCWGFNGAGQLGDGFSGTSSSNPVDVVGLDSSVVAVSAHGHTCALMSSGGVKCWGANDHGQLGNGTTEDSATPVDVLGLNRGVTAIAAGAEHTCAVTDVGILKCWGRNDIGQLGLGTDNGPEQCLGDDCSTLPVVVALGTRVDAVSLGGAHTCAVIEDGTVKCWGRNSSGQLGNNTYQHSAEPVEVVGLTTSVSSLSLGTYHSCALTASGGVECWGANFSNQLGDDASASRDTADIAASLNTGIVGIAAGAEHTCALTAAAGVKCWGANAQGQLGNGTFTGPTCGGTCNPNAVDVVGLTTGVVAIAAGQGHTCALMSGGSIKCWGQNDYGQLGNGTRTYSSTIVDVGIKGPSDTDHDGCPDSSEVEEDPGTEKSGGNRNLKNHYDYFNPTHDGNNRLDDLLMVVQAYLKDDKDANPGMPPYAPGYNPDTDRTDDPTSSESWDLLVGDGQQRIDDILAVIKQYFHDCS